MTSFRFATSALNVKDFLQHPRPLSFVAMTSLTLVCRLSSSLCFKVLSVPYSTLTLTCHPRVRPSPFPKKSKQKKSPRFRVSSRAGECQPWARAKSGGNPRPFVSRKNYSNRFVITWKANTVIDWKETTTTIPNFNSRDSNWQRYKL